MTGAIVTGAGRGLGAAIARRLHRDGLSVALCDLDADAVVALAGELGPGAVPVAMDVRDERDWERALHEAEELAPVAVLVNNAARLAPGELFDLATDEWDDVLATNVRGAYLGIKVVGRAVRDRGRGRVVNISSDAAFSGSGVLGAHYAASKAALLALTRRAAVELAPSGVTVNAVAPGAIEGETLRELVGTDTSVLAASIPVGRLGRPEEVASLVSWLASGEAGYVTGSTFRIDGGAGVA